jgi:glycolate oxidase iron-sulfur subunit
MGAPNSGPERAPECVLCGCCLEGCPLLAATGREELSPRAKALLAGPSKFTAAELDAADVAALAGLCLACGRCEKLCPQKVSVPALVARQRALHPDFRRWLWKQWITRLGPMWGLAARGAAIAPDALVPAQFSLALKGLRGLRPGAGLAPWLSITDLPAEAFAAKHGARPVVVFDGCVGRGPRKTWGYAARALLRRLGATLVEAEFCCCGSTLGVAGLPDEQAEVRRANVAAWRAAGRPLLVTYCATCRKGLADYAGGGAAGIFADDAEAAQWKAAIAPLSALLAGAKAKAGRGAPSVVGWHRPCHTDPADSDFALMQSLLGARLRTPAKGLCCGFGGIMQLGAPELSGLVGADCWQSLDGVLGFSAAPEVTPAYVLTGCSGCVMQLAATAPAGARVGHWLEIVKPG